MGVLSAFSTNQRLSAGLLAVMAAAILGWSAAQGATSSDGAPVTNATSEGPANGDESTPTPNADSPSPSPEDPTAIPGSTPSAAVNDPKPSTPAEDVPGRTSVVTELIGLDEYTATVVAEGYGYTVRIAARDGEDFVLTMDYSSQRVNLTIQDGIVTDGFIG